MLPTGLPQHEHGSLRDLTAIYWNIGFYHGMR